jgi:glycosyltransferase involved in cell wall biosynthesis
MAMIERVFVIDPNLIKAAGHPIEYSLALQYACQTEGTPVFVVTHRSVRQEVLSLLTLPIPAISRTCFSLTPDQPQLFFRDLQRLNELCCFTGDDLIIVTSAYVNEIVGAALFEASITVNDRPLIALNFHQLLPPAKDASLPIRPEFRDYWMRELSRAFGAVERNDGALSFWTTDSKGLNMDYAALANRDIGLLPQLFAMHVVETSDRVPFGVSPRIRLGFLGDGRQEKGLPILLRTVMRIREAPDQFIFVIQVADIRGYSSDERSLLDTMLFHVQKRQDVCFVQGSLLPSQYHELFRSLDAVLLPYHPDYYSERASGVFVQAVLYHKPVVASSGTWMAEEILNGNAGGLVFDYVEADPEATAHNLERAIHELQEHIVLYQSDAAKHAVHYERIHKPERYLEILRNYYNRGG